ncbi:uncharacterized protein LOC119727389 [Patiria miniata]|uniref:HAT C-terminal dimerisation domain-containing protein n=1 Tax=Patiria miniata TaxID=46514 RepID=A0A913ZUD2_PATMI|nr:uncharacterized protein LOC119727389 [Patiria miniata]
MQDLNFQLFCYFLDAVLLIFDQANTLLQLDKPCIHILLRTLLQQLKDLLNCFVKPSVVNASKKITQVQHQNIQNQKSDQSLFVGKKTNDFIAANTNSKELDLPKFYASVRRFFSKAVEYMLKKFPYDDPVLSHAAVVDVTVGEDMEFASVEFFVQHFLCIQLNSNDNDKLEREFMVYQTRDLPESITSCDRADTQWHLMSRQKDGNGQLIYSLLSKVMLAILCIFHSNADCERIFSLVTKNRTEFRPNMKTETLSSLITHKQFIVAKGTVCHRQTYSLATLQKAKSATYAQLSGSK